MISDSTCVFQDFILIAIKSNVFLEAREVRLEKSCKVIYLAGFQSLNEWILSSIPFSSSLQKADSPRCFVMVPPLKRIRW